MNQGVLYKYDQVQESDEQIYHFIEIEKALDRIKNWKGMRRDVKNYTRNFIKCQRHKPNHLKPTAYSRGRGEMILIV